MAEVTVCASCRWQRQVVSGMASAEWPYRWCSNPLSMSYAMDVGAEDSCDRYRAGMQSPLGAIEAAGPEQTF
jgi:hypothetical protein